MDDFSILIELLKDVLGRPRRHTESKGQISFDCPVCSHDIKGLDKGDGKGNFEVNYINNVFKCWSCGETHDTHGSLYRLFNTWGNKIHLKKLSLIIPDEFIKQEKVYKPIKIPKEFISFAGVSRGVQLTHHYKRAKYYIDQRSITEEQIKKYNIGFCYEGEYADHIIIPSYDRENNLNYFVARNYGESRRKYKNPEAEKEKIIFNERFVDFSRDVYIVEGPFDHIFVENSIPLLGKKLSNNLWSKLYDEAKGLIYICLDGDAYNDALMLYSKLHGGKLQGRVKVIRLPDEKDIADLKGQINNDWIIQLEYDE